MSSFNQEFNFDNTILRYVFVALLGELRDKIYFYNKIDEDNSKKIEIPFYPSLTGMSRFLLDNFKYTPETEGKAIGDYDKDPRGIVTLSDIRINAQSITNKFTRGTFTKMYQGELKTFSLMHCPLPVTLSFDIIIVVNNMIEILKATESIISKLYKSSKFFVDLGGFQVPANLSVPEDFQSEKLFTYAINEKQDHQILFQMEVSTFMPIFEDGILLSEIPFIIRESENNPHNRGIGIYRDGGIFFGNVMENITGKIDDIDRAPFDDTFSNLRFNAEERNENTPDPPFGEFNVNEPDPNSIEDQDSINYRNQDENISENTEDNSGDVSNSALC